MTCLSDKEGELTGAISETEDDYDENTGIVTASCSSIRLGTCEVCAAKNAIYTCPKCEVKTCCQRCVQIHKKELNCDGIRDRTKFIPLSKMTKCDFMSDYYFLEDCTRFVQKRKYDPGKRFTRYEKLLPTHLFRLRNAAAERHITLRFLLQNFTRHQINTTYYNWQKRKIYWRIEWIFENACGLKCVDERCAEDLPLYRLLDKYVNIENEEASKQCKSLLYYQSIGAFNLKILLKAEGIKRSRTRFYELDVAKTLAENLANKTVVEFPSISVIYDKNATQFDIIESDEDVEVETKTYQAALDELHKKERKLQYDGVNNQRSVIDSEEDEYQKLQKILDEKRLEERQRKRDEFERTPNNFLFTDENLWDILSSSDEGNATEEETVKPHTIKA